MLLKVVDEVERVVMEARGVKMFVTTHLLKDKVIVIKWFLDAYILCCWYLFDVNFGLVLVLVCKGKDSSLYCVSIKMYSMW